MKFSVLMSVYYKADANQLREALTSIWDEQTCRPDQVVLVEDGPLPNEVKQVIASFQQKLGDKLLTPKFEKNQGLARALNLGLQHCSFEWVARMDADDISLPDRFANQLNFLHMHPDIAVLGTQVSEWDESMMREISKKRLPTAHHDLRAFISWRCPMNHPTVIFRKAAILSVGGYPDTYPEDWLLWGKLLVSNYKIANLSTIDVKMRMENACFDRRGLSFLWGELQTLRNFHQMGLMSTFVLIRNSILRLFLRTAPRRLRQYFYKQFRQ